MEPFSQSTNSLLDVFIGTFFFIYLASDWHTSLPIKWSNYHLNELSIIIQRSKILFSIELRMFFCVFFELSYSLLKTLTFWKKIVDLLELLVIFALLRFTSSFLNGLNVQRYNESSNPVVWRCSFIQTFFVMLPNFRLYCCTKLNNDISDYIGCCIFWSYFLFILFFFQ